MTGGRVGVGMGAALIHGMTFVLAAGASRTEPQAVMQSITAPASISRVRMTE